MDSPYRIKIIPCQNGERFPILVDRNNGMPLYYPNLYLTTAVRGAAKQDKTLLKYIQAIKFVYDWGIKYNINLEHRFNAGEFLKLHEIEALVGDIYARADNLLDNSVPTTNNPSINRIKKGMKLEIDRCGYAFRKSPRIVAAVV